MRIFIIFEISTAISTILTRNIILKTLLKDFKTLKKKQRVTRNDSFFSNIDKIFTLPNLRVDSSFSILKNQKGDSLESQSKILKFKCHSSLWIHPFLIELSRIEIIDRSLIRKVFATSKGFQSIQNSLNMIFFLVLKKVKNAFLKLSFVLSSMRTYFFSYFNLKPLFLASS